MTILNEPWPWYVAGPIMGLTVPILLIIGNKSLGISSILRHTCAACIPAGIPFFKYDWKKEVWNIMFVVGIVLGGFIGVKFIPNSSEIVIHEDLKSELKNYGITDYTNSIVPEQIVKWDNLFTLQGFILLIMGGFLVGFGTRYAGGCTSGHVITGISMLQWPSLLATISFMVGGFFAANFLLPLVFNL